MQQPAPAPIRIGLLGGECTGKSTLADALGASLPACVAPEAARSFVLRTGRPPHRGEQAGLLAAQAAAADEAATTCPHAAVVVDPAPLMTAVYSVLYFGDDSLLPPALDDALTYDLLAWCAPDLPWTADPGMRDGPEYRDAAERVLGDVVDGLLVPRGATVVRVTGELGARVAVVRAALGRTPRGRAWQRGGPPAAT